MKTLYIIILTICFLSCSKKKQAVDDSIVIEGDLINELTNNKYNPFTSATVDLYDKSSIQVPTSLSSATVDQNGHYKLTSNHPFNEDGFLILHGNIGYNYASSITNNIVFARTIKSDFIVRCSSTLVRTFVHQSSNPYDSIIVLLSNSKETLRLKYTLYAYRSVLLSTLRGQEPNYLNSKFYYSNTFIQRFDTINTNCLTIVRDSIFY